MAKKVFTTLLTTLLLILSQSRVTATQIIFHEDFHSLEEWREIENAQSWDPHLPCRDENGPTLWRHTEFGFGAEISDGVPCFVVLGGPKIEQHARIVEVDWQWYFTEPYQDRNFILHWQDAENWFGLHVFGNMLYLEGKDQGQAVLTSTVPAHYSFRAHTTYSFRVREDTETGDIKVWVNQVLIAHDTIENLARLPFRPSLAASVGHGVRSSQSYFRELSIWNGPTPLTVTAWKQTDSPWAVQEYDSASTWSAEAATIGRWGCALTSAAMILDAAGVKQLPSGELLNPGSLNTWLQGEANGYIGPGLLNWRAIAKIALWHNQEFGTTKLEFSATTPEQKEEWLRDKLSHRFPVILEQPQHFVVATEWPDGDNSPLILDPAYSRESLEQYGNTYLSARVFTPSATNLQGATLVAPIWARLRATTALGDLVPLIPLESTPFSLPGDQLTAGWQMWDAPPWGLGPLLLISEAAMTVPVLGAWYSEDGQEFSVPATLSPQQVTSIDSTTPLPPLTDQDFARLLSWQEIKSPVIWLWHTSFLSSPTSESAEQYRWLLNLAHANNWLSSSALALLSTEINSHFPP